MDASVPVKIPSFMNSRYFETHFFERLRTALQDEHRKVVLDMRSVVWADLMELLCIPLAICWQKGKKRDVELVCFRPFFSNHMEHTIMNISGLDTPLPSVGEVKKLRNDSQYKSNSEFFWGTLIPFCFFERILELEVPCYLENWHGHKVLLTPSIYKLLAPKENLSLRYYRIKNIYKHEQVDDAIEGVRKMLQNFTFNEDAQKDVCLRMIYHAGANIFDHAYGNGFDFPDPLKKGFVAVRLFSTKGFHQILRHAPQEIKKYMEYLRSDGETISIVVADAGKGIWRALDPSKKMSELECIKEAFKKGISSKTVKDSSDPKRGLGLYRVQKFINEQKGYLEIRSGRSRYIMIPKEVCMIHGIYPDDLSIDGKLEEFPGVQFRIYIPLNACAKKEKQLFMFDEGYLWNRNSNS